LEEIEAAMMAEEGIREAAVAVRENERGDKLLIGYLTKEGEYVDTGLLRSRLAQKLPDYMVPTLIVVLDELPITANGKLDRSALPVPDLGANRKTSRPPRTLQERTLCSIFSEVLGVESVGLDDNFFELGGHSLMASQLVSRIRVALGVECQLRDIFIAPTVAKLTAILSALMGFSQDSTIDGTSRRRVEDEYV
jgi:acyl carrier protein